MLPPNLQTPNEVKRYYDSVYFSLVDSGGYTPFLYPWATCGAAIILLYLLTDHRNSPALRSLRYPIFSVLLAFEIWCLLTNKARAAAAAYGVGLVSSWGTLWLATIMVFHDCQTDFKRIERTDQRALNRTKDRLNGTTQNGNGLSEEVENSKRLEQLHASEKFATQGPVGRSGPLIWQSYPTGPFIERLDWVLDLFCNFRGVGWNFEASGIPLPSSQVRAEMESGIRKVPAHASPEMSRTGIHRFSDRKQLLSYTITRFVVGYFLIDFVHVLMHHDPHFWGYIDTPNMPSYIPAFVSESAGLRQAYRLLLCVTAISAVLTQIMRMGPLLFVGVLGPKFVGLRGEAWMNPPDFYGSFQPVFRKGLAGWWGGFWHQTFRYAFEIPGVRLLEALDIDRRSKIGRTIALFVAFFCSGILHACGSATQLGDTRPIRGPMCFFLLQAVGITVQTLVVEWLKGLGVTARTPNWISRWTNFIYAVTWMYWTAPLLMDDFARGGVWLFEPVPISPFRAFGFGAKDDGWYDLWFGMMSWRRGKGLWSTGIQF